MRFINIMLALIVAVVVISPAMALNNQIISSVATGDGTVQNLENTVYEDHQDASASQGDGSHNTQIVTNNKIVGTASQSQSQVMILNVPKPKAVYKGFDIGVINTRITSVYEGEPFIVMNDEDLSSVIISQPGDKFRYTVKSSIPVLAYVVAGKDINRVLYDDDVAPKYDTFLRKFDLGGIQTAYIGKYRSPSQMFDVTIKEPARYALVVDGRVAHEIDGRNTKISGDTFDVFIMIERINNYETGSFNKTRIGNVSTFPSLPTGMADTSA